ncbi:MAG: stage 0 sporulation family protein [Bacillota bacterium]|nr:stage 0 sporulation family protein [Bacillota bacterium]
MVKVVGVRFKRAGKIYYFNPEDKEINQDEYVIVETARGIEFGRCVVESKEVSEDDIVSPLKSVIRKATKEDIKKHKENKEKEKDAFQICLNKIGEHKLSMKLIDVEYTFDNNKIIFYFTAQGRVDFRELVKDLATVFRTRIELRQIGVRDEAKMVGGIGPCGRILCCHKFLGDFAPVSIKMAKEQSLSLNPAKISGLCGRLMCCLNYEQNTYERIREKLPRVGSIVDTPEGRGEVVANSVVKERVTIKVSEKDGEALKNVKLFDTVLVEGSFEGTIEDEEVRLDIDPGEVDINQVKELLKED